MVHIHNGILLSHKRNTSESVLLRWMNLEPIIQREVSQKKKDKHHILTIVNSAAVNNGIHVSLPILVSSGYMPRSGVAGSYGGFIFSV